MGKAHADNNAITDGGPEAVERQPGLCPVGDLLRRFTRIFGHLIGPVARRLGISAPLRLGRLRTLSRQAQAFGLDLGSLGLGLRSFGLGLRVFSHLLRSQGLGQRGSGLGSRSSGLVSRSSGRLGLGNGRISSGFCRCLLGFGLELLGLRCCLSQLSRRSFGLSRHPGCHVRCSLGLGVLEFLQDPCRFVLVQSATPAACGESDTGRRHECDRAPPGEPRSLRVGHLSSPL